MASLRSSTLAISAIACFLYLLLLSRTSHSAIGHDHSSISKDHHSPPVTPIIAYAATVTLCGDFYDGAAVLAHSIKEAHSGVTYPTSYPSYRLILFLHPEAGDCAPHFESIGWEVLVRDTPLKVDEIQGDNLRTKIEANGCCGEKELVKFWAYTLVEYDIVFHVDLDVVIFKPLDVLFDILLKKKGATSDAAKAAASMGKVWDTNADYEALYTFDYNMIAPGKCVKK
jgi:hypothetical protein